MDEWFDDLKLLIVRGPPIDENWIKKDLQERLEIREVQEFVGPQMPERIRKRRNNSIRFKRNLQKAMHHYAKMGFRHL